MKPLSYEKHSILLVSPEKLIQINMPGMSNINKFSIHALSSFVLLLKFLIRAKPHTYKFNTKHFERVKYITVYSRKLLNIY